MDQEAHANAGLIGVVVVTRAGDARPHGQPADVDRELFALFQVWLGFGFGFRFMFRVLSVPGQDLHESQALPCVFALLSAMQPLCAS